MLYKSLTQKIIGCMYKVHYCLGCALPEQPYHKALFIELQKHFNVSFKQSFKVCYEGELVGEYFPDLVVEGKIIIEVKAVSALSKENQAQLLNYLNLSGRKLGLLVNFRPRKLEFQRMVLTEPRQTVYLAD